MHELIDLAKEYETAQEELDRVQNTFSSVQHRVDDLRGRIETVIGQPPKPGRKAQTSSNGHALHGHAADIRAWAKLNKMECPERGRIPNRIVDAYRQSHQL